MVASSFTCCPASTHDNLTRIAMGLDACSAVVDTVIVCVTVAPGAMVDPLAVCMASVIVFGTAACSEKFSNACSPALTYRALTKVSIGSSGFAFDAEKKMDKPPLVYAGAGACAEGTGVGSTFAGDAVTGG